jgi:methyl-accepting chemotaxis protein
MNAKIRLRNWLSWRVLRLEKAYALEQSGKLSREAAQAQAKLALSSFQKGDKYFFVRDNTNDVLLVHIKQDRIGKADKDAKSSGDVYRAALKGS